jgi:hypothetical protein
MKHVMNAQQGSLEYAFELNMAKAHFLELP